MRIEYHIEIYEVNDSSCVAASYQSETPFMGISVGDVIHGGSMNLSSINKTVRISNIQHIIWEIKDSHIGHKLCIFTEPL